MKILTYPDPVLKTVAKQVDDIDEEVRTLVDRMINTMYAAPGIGLAANQVGELRRVIVFDASPGETGRDPRVLINPEILLSEGSVKYEEACLSVPDFSSEVDRKAHVKVTGVDLAGKPVNLEAHDLLAICLQHEIDHLNGMLFIDHISSLKRSLFKKKLKKKLKKSQDQEI